jgi:thiaminase/transcriptional activator TenA
MNPPTSTATTMRFTDELRQAAGDQWDRVIHLKFTKELATGTIDRTVLKRYLIQDHRFLDAFVILLASIIANVRSLDDRIPGCLFLATITGKENTYFERAFHALSVSNHERTSIPDASCTQGFCQLMKDVAFHGTLAEMLAVIVVCEWSYQSWGTIVVQNEDTPVVRDDFVCYEWVDLHSGESFDAVVQYLRTLLDNEAAYLSDEEKEKCTTRFLSAVQLEEDFFNYAYE